MMPDYGLLTDCLKGTLLARRVPFFIGVIEILCSDVMMLRCNIRKMQEKLQFSSTGPLTGVRNPDLLRGSPWQSHNLSLGSPLFSPTMQASVKTYGRKRN
ncbi:hypothetical protein [Thalassospira sp. TSL5-1]|uniref:hypothetical protein n=1 Tax=Thalassospira sp. TSL5-1 TaxID=1544451 RepID=UPI00116107E1|nr:hypothetical protein [Thalassospira sp. TSL5-1]